MTDYCLSICMGLLTKVSTPLSENVTIGPNVSIYCVPPFFSCTDLTLLGMEFTRASQVTTGFLFYSFMMTSRSWWVLETMRSSTFCLRMPQRLHFSKAVVILEMCLRVVTILEYCPVAQSLQGGDHALLQYVKVHVGIHGSLNEL